MQVCDIKSTIDSTSATTIISILKLWSVEEKFPMGFFSIWLQNFKSNQDIFPLVYNDP